MTSINPEALLDRCYAMLNRAYEESYGRGYAYREPVFRFVLSYEEIIALRKHVATPGTTSYIYVVDKGKNILFGHELCEQRRTPYLEAIVGTVGAMK